MFLSDLLAVVCSAFTFLTLFNYLNSRRTLPLPPGPKRLPFFGNLFDIPTTGHHLTFAKWGKEYGDVVHVNVFGYRLIILNSHSAAKELLDSRSTIYSDRPYIPMLHDPSLMDQGHTFVLRKYGPEWRHERRLFSQYLGRTISKGYHEVQIAAAHSLLRSILDDPDQLSAHLRRAAAEAILAIAYGYQIKRTNDPFVESSECALKLGTLGALPGRFFVNVLPWMKYIPTWMPGAGFKKLALLAKEASRRAMDLPFEDARRRIDEGKAQPSLVTSAITESSTWDSLSSIKSVAATMYGAGTDTTLSSMESCMLAFILYPEVQSRAQAELDTVIGSPTSPTFRLPTFADRPRLPYIDAIVKESLRWIPVVPIGVPHSLTQDDVYRGWKIPKGSTIIFNTWSLLRDEKTYPNPSVFRPERYLGDDPASHPLSRGCFGFGRRECPGRHIAEANIWIVVANILAAFKISSAKDNKGRVIDVNYASEPLSGLTLRPQHFPFTLKPRTREAEMRIRETNIAGGLFHVV